MKEVFKKNFAVIVAFLLPLVLIIVVALSVYIPSLFISTKYNFVYTTCSYEDSYSPYNCNYYNYNQKRYSVENGRFVIPEIDPNQDLDKNGIPDEKQGGLPRIFMYNTKTHESKEITVGEASSFKYSSLLTSPDGVTLSNGYQYNGSGFFPFVGGYNSYDYYLVKGSSKKKLNLFNGDNRYYYQNNFQFIGWVLTNND